MSDRELFQCGVEMACGRSYDLLGDLRDCDKVLFTECNFISSLLRALSKHNAHEYVPQWSCTAYVPLLIFFLRF